MDITGNNFYPLYLHLQIKDCQHICIKNLNWFCYFHKSKPNQSLKEIYIGIREANNVIAKVPTIDMDENLRNRIVGEAKFLRALHYFNL